MGSDTLTQQLGEPSDDVRCVLVSSVVPRQDLPSATLMPLVALQRAIEAKPD